MAMNKQVKTALAALIALSGILAAGFAVWWKLLAK
jgi:hypothetical protein